LQVLLVSEDKTGKNQISPKVKDVTTVEVITIDKKATIKEAADTVDKNEINYLITAREERAIGIITERDLLQRVIVKTKNPEILHQIPLLKFKIAKRKLEI
jgi:predicted transcriptional regulator